MSPFVLEAIVCTENNVPQRTARLEMYGLRIVNYTVSIRTHARMQAELQANVV